jgi:hypothetical protein
MMSAAAFDAVDANHDGVISRAEWERAGGAAGTPSRPIRPPGRRPGRSQSPPRPSVSAKLNVNHAYIKAGLQYLNKSEPNTSAPVPLQHEATLGTTLSQLHAPVSTLTEPNSAPKLATKGLACWLQLYTQLQSTVAQCHHARDSSVLQVQPLLSKEALRDEVTRCKRRLGGPDSGLVLCLLLLLRSLNPDVHPDCTDASEHRTAYKVADVGRS